MAGVDAGGSGLSPASSQNMIPLVGSTNVLRLGTSSSPVTQPVIPVRLRAQGYLGCLIPGVHPS
jgi:hypothetical protein